MILERTNNEILIRLPANIDLVELQNMLDFLDYKEQTSSSKAKQIDIEKLAKTVNKKMWTNFKSKRNIG